MDEKERIGYRKSFLGIFYRYTPLSIFGKGFSDSRRNFLVGSSVASAFGPTLTLASNAVAAIENTLVRINNWSQYLTERFYNLTYSERSEVLEDKSSFSLLASDLMKRDNDGQFFFQYFEVFFGGNRPVKSDKTILVEDDQRTIDQVCGCHLIHDEIESVPSRLETPFLRGPIIEVKPNDGKKYSISGQPEYLPYGGDVLNFSLVVLKPGETISMEQFERMSVSRIQAMNFLNDTCREKNLPFRINCIEPFILNIPELNLSNYGNEHIMCGHIAEQLADALGIKDEFTIQTKDINSGFTKLDYIRNLIKQMTGIDLVTIDIATSEVYEGRAFADTGGGRTRLRYNDNAHTQAGLIVHEWLHVIWGLLDYYIPRNNGRFNGFYVGNTVDTQIRDIMNSRVNMFIDTKTLEAMGASIIKKVRFFSGSGTEELTELPVSHEHTIPDTFSVEIKGRQLNLTISLSHNEATINSYWMYYMDADDNSFPQKYLLYLYTLEGDLIPLSYLETAGENSKQFNLIYEIPNDLPAGKFILMNKNGVGRIIAENQNTIRAIKTTDISLSGKFGSFFLPIEGLEEEYSLEAFYFKPELRRDPRFFTQQPVFVGPSSISGHRSVELKHDLFPATGKYMVVVRKKSGRSPIIFYVNYEKYPYKVFLPLKRR